MITSFQIQNFKSLENFRLPPAGRKLGGFTCLIGLNGAGKSTLLQAFDFIAHVATGDVNAWLESREWKKRDLLSNLASRKSPLINFELAIRTDAGEEIIWSARFNAHLLKCTHESIVLGERHLLKVADNQWTVAMADDSPDTSQKLSFEYEGSVLSSLKVPGAHSAVEEVKGALQGLRSFELLSPRAMRRRGKKDEDIGPGGEKLSSYLGRFNAAQRETLLAELKRFYPQLRDWSVNTMRFGWKNLRVHENYGGGMGVDATHLNDGLLRVITILAQAQSRHAFLLFDEIENGINPALVEKLMDFLVALGSQSKQVVVTTHSPVILNYLSDEVARESVVLLYKKSTGQTESCFYFDQPETERKLDFLGPGEVFVDTDLIRLVDRLSS